VAVLSRHRYLVLLLTLVAILIVQSFPGPPGFLSAVVAPVSILSILLVVFRSRRERIVAAVAAAAAIAVNWAQFVPVADEHRIILAGAHSGLRVLFPSFAVGVILRDILAETVIAADQVLGAVCGYLVAAAAWAHLYVFTEILVPGSFSMSHDLAAGFAGQHEREAIFYYFSLVTLTTMGYGDITPLRPPATVLVTLEAVFGQFYIAVVVAQLVGLRLARPSR
jgi:hypothetical protein